MKKILLFIYVFLSGSPFLLAQNAIYDKIFSNTPNAYSQIVPTNDGGLAILEGHLNKNKVGTEEFLFSLDKDGKLLASKTHNFNEVINRTYVGIFKQLKDNNFLVILKSPINLNSSLVKTDVNFNPIWSLNIINKKTNLFFERVLELGNGNILLVGTASLTGTGPRYYYYAEISPNGDLIRYQLYKLLCNKKPNVCPSILYDAKVSPDGKLFLSIEGIETFIGPTIVGLDIVTGKILFQSTIKSVADSYGSILGIFYDDKSNTASNQIVGFDTEQLKNGDNKINVFALDAKNGSLKFVKSYNFLGGEYFCNFVEKVDGNILLIYDSKGVTYNINFDKQGNIVNANKELNQNENNFLNSVQLKDGRIVSIAYYNYCKNKYETIIKFRGENDESPCSISYMPEKLLPTLTDSSKNIIEIFNDKIDIEKNVFPPFFDYDIKLIDRPLSCQKDTVEVKICLGGQYQIGKKIYTKSGIYLDTLKTIRCDSTYYTKLSISNKPKTDSIQRSFCKGEKFTFLNKNYDTEGVFEIKLKTQFGCDSILFLNLKTEDFELFSTPDLTIKSGVETQLEAKANATNLSWQWSPNTYLSCTDCDKPIVKPLESINYTIQAKSKSGCVAKGNQKITILPCNFVFVPNAFSPNGDGINDRLIVNASDCATSIKRYQIYDRWGELVYDRSDIPANDSEYGWDGKFKNKAAASGVYVYRLQVEFANGKIQNLCGDVLLSN